MRGPAVLVDGTPHLSIPDPFPVPRSPFPVPRSPFPVPRSPFPVPRSPFPGGTDCASRTGLDHSPHLHYGASAAVLLYPVMM